MTIEEKLQTFLTSNRINVIRRLLLGDQLYEDCSNPSKQVSREQLKARLDEIYLGTKCVKDCDIDELVKMCKLKEYQLPGNPLRRRNLVPKCYRKNINKSTECLLNNITDLSKRKELAEKYVDQQASEADLCPICFQETKDGLYPVQLKCGHSAHVGCLMSWLSNQESKTCPFCRQPFNRAELLALKKAEEALGVALQQNAVQSVVKAVGSEDVVENIKDSDDDDTRAVTFSLFVAWLTAFIAWLYKNYFSDLSTSDLVFQQTVLTSLVLLISLSVYKLPKRLKKNFVELGKSIADAEIAKIRALYSDDLGKLQEEVMIAESQLLQSVDDSLAQDMSRIRMDQIEAQRNANFQRVVDELRSRALDDDNDDVDFLALSNTAQRDANLHRVVNELQRRAQAPATQIEQDAVYEHEDILSLRTRLFDRLHHLWDTLNEVRNRIQSHGLRHLTMSTNDYRDYRDLILDLDRQIRVNLFTRNQARDESYIRSMLSVLTRIDAQLLQRIAR